MTEEPASEEPDVHDFVAEAADLVSTVLQGSMEAFTLFDCDDDNSSTCSLEDIDGSLDDDEEEALMSEVSPAPKEEEVVQEQPLMLPSSFCEKAAFQEGDAFEEWGSCAPSHDLFGDRPFERYFQSFGHAAVLEADIGVPSLADMEMDQPCMGPAEEEFANEGCLTEEFVVLISTLATDIPANLAASKIQWSFRMMQEWRQVQLQQWEMRSMLVNRGVRCQDQAASKIQHAWREMQIWREVQLRLWQERSMVLNSCVRDPNQAAGQIQRAFRRKMKAVQRTKERFAAERSFALEGANSLAQVLCPEVDFGASALDSSATAIGFRPEEPNPLDAEEIANVWASFCGLFDLARADAAVQIQKAWRAYHAKKRPTKLVKVQAPPPSCCPITRMLEAMKALQDSAREEAAARIQKQYRKVRSTLRARREPQVHLGVPSFAAMQMDQPCMEPPDEELPAAWSSKTEPFVTEAEAARCLQQAFRSFRMRKAAKQIHDQMAVEATKTNASCAKPQMNPLPPSAPKGTGSRRPSTRKGQGEASIVPVQPSGDRPLRPSGRRVGQPSTQAPSASITAPISPKALASVESGPSPRRRRPVHIGIPQSVQSFQIDDPNLSPAATTGKAIANEFAALGAEIFSVSTPRSKGSKSAASSISVKSPRALSANMQLCTESPRRDRVVSSPFGKRTPSLNAQSQEPSTPRTPRGTKRASTLLPDLPQVQRSGGENTARMVEAITRMVPGCKTLA